MEGGYTMKCLACESSNVSNYIKPHYLVCEDCGYESVEDVDHLYDEMYLGRFYDETHDLDFKRDEGLI